MVTIHYNGTTINVQEDDSTFRYRSIMGECYVTLNFQLDKAIDFPVGTYIVYQGRTYTLTSPEHWKRWGVHKIEYTLTLHGEQEALKKYKLRNLQDGRLKFPMMATPAEFLQLIVGNLNASGRESGWTGTCLITAEEKQIEFNHASLIDALTDIASKFETEFEITEDKCIRLGKVEYYKSDPLPLAYGKGNGFKPGTGRTNTDDSKPVEILYVQGGGKNIDRSKYGSSELLLPKGQILTYEGRQYIASDDGFSIKRNDKALQYKNEDSIDLSDIYPKREGVISRVVTVDVDKHFYDFEDSSIPPSLDYNDCLIDGETLTVIFQTGMLAGREFEISKYTHVEDDGQGNEVAARRFEVVPAEMDGYVMPCEIFLPAAGDKYIILNCMLPDAYIRDNANQSGAEWDLFREAARFMYENEDFKFTFTGELQAKWAKEHWETLSLSSRLVLGAYIRFMDDDFASGGVDMRITGIKDFFNDPYAPVIEISNGVMAAGFSSQLREPEQNEVRIGDSYERSVAFTKRRWRDARETMTALEEAMAANFQNFSSAINPIAVQTMQLLVGDESLQFRFVNSKVTPVEVSHAFTYNDQTKVFSTDAGIIQHMTLGIANMAAAHQAAEYKFWDMSAFSSSNLGGDNADKKFYLYAKCGKSNRTGVFVISNTPIAMEGVTGYYHLLVGILNSEYEGSRSFVTLYGFTEILPGRITTDRIVSGSGQTYWDLVANILKLGDKLSYNLNGDGAFILNGPLVQTGAGTPAEVGAWCGEWSGTRTYKLGDEVWKAASNGTVSTYRYVNSAPSLGHDVTDDNYWEVYAAGVKGDPGQDGTDGEDGADGKGIRSTNVMYNSSSSGTTAPASGWSSSIPAVNAGYYLWTRTVITYTDGTSSTSYSSARQGGDGAAGAPGPALAYQGAYSPNKTYYGNSSRVDAVYYNGQYYVAKSSAGSFAGRVPTNTTYWNTFGASFDSVATGLLLAEESYIENAIVRKLRTAESGRRVIVQDNVITMYDTDGAQKMLVTGEELGAISEAVDSRSFSAGQTGRVSDTEIDSTITLLSSLPITNVSNTVEIPSVTVDVYFAATGGVTNGQAWLTIDGKTVSISAGVDGSTAEGRHLYFVIPAVALTLSEGAHTLALRVTATGSGLSAASSYDGGTVTIAYKARQTQIGANGFRSAWSATSYADFTDGAFILRCGDYILRVSSSGIQKSTNGGSSWQSV